MPLTQFNKVNRIKNTKWNRLSVWSFSGLEVAFEAGEFAAFDGAVGEDAAEVFLRHGCNGLAVKAHDRRSGGEVGDWVALRCRHAARTCRLTDVAAVDASAAGQRAGQLAAVLNS